LTFIEHPLDNLDGRLRNCVTDTKKGILLKGRS
jgi:hypothetical protein